MSDAISFGIGCFQFGIAKDWKNVKLSQYFTELEKELEKISSVSRCRLNYYIDEDIEIEELKATNIGAGEALPLADVYFDMQLDLHIPFRVQKDLLGEDPETNTENFIVIIKYQYYFPVCIIVLKDAGRESRPSNAIVIIRRFFERSIAGNNYIKFEFLGPSPFHANLFIAQDCDDKLEKNRNGFYCVKRLSRGYDDIIFYYDSNVYSSVDEAFDALLKEIDDEISVYYRLVSIEYLLMDKWEEIADKVQSVLEVSKNNGYFSSFVNAFKLSKQIDQFIILLSMFEHDLIEIRKNIKTMLGFLQYHSCYIYLKQYIDKAQEDLLVFPTKELFRMVNLLEAKRSKKIELLSYFMSACVGGAAGGFISLLVK